MIVSEPRPFDTVLDVGGNIGDFAERALSLWPRAHVISFEPVRRLARENRLRARGRWQVQQVAISDETAPGFIRVCENQLSASTLQQPGPARRELFGITDRWRDEPISLARLDDYLLGDPGRLLVKVDVEGHELQALRGAPCTLAAAAAVVVEVQNDPRVFLDGCSAADVHALLAAAGLAFTGVAEALRAPDGRVLQFDAMYRRASVGEPVPVAAAGPGEPHA